MSVFERFSRICHPLGVLVLIEALFLVVPLVYAVTASEPVLVFLLPFFGALVFGSLGYRRAQPTDYRLADLFLLVTVGWCVLALIGMLPYLLSGTFVAVSDAFFEVVSGFTTTGATVIPELGVVPESVLLWRSITQWLGGMGFVTLMIALLPFVRAGSAQLYNAESPGVAVDRLKPRIKETAGTMWVIYAVLTVGAAVLFVIGGMSVFEAVNHALTTLSTGGFSTLDTSIATYSPYIQYTIMCFMLIGGVNYALLYALTRGSWGALRRNEELRYYLGIVIGVGVLVSALRWVQEGVMSEASVRAVFFHVISLMTTTGYVTTDYAQWAPGAIALLVLVMGVGGMTTSTAGGVKVLRVVVMLRYVRHEFLRVLVPHAVIPMRVSGSVVSPVLVSRIIALGILYVCVVVCAILVFLFAGHDFATSIGVVVASVGNVGPGLGIAGPVATYAALSAPLKVFLALLMIIGRLEFFTVLALLSRHFWRRF